MRLRFGEGERDVDRGDTLTFGRDAESVDLRVTAPDDVSVSRQAGRLEFDEFAWRVTNTGRRSFFVVEAGDEIELRPGANDRSSHQIIHEETWIRIPRAQDDVALELDIPSHERPSTDAVQMAISGWTSTTQVELDVDLTENERRSVVAVYEGYLELPPRYRREPSSYRAAGRRISAEEGKVKADLRRVQEKVAKAGGPDPGGSRGRDALIVWLVSRRVITRTDLALVDRS